MRSALIAGGSLGGLFAANILLRSGWDVTVAERVAGPLAGRGAGIVTHPPLFEALRRAGVDPAASVGVEVQGRVTFAPDGRTICDCILPQVFTSWSRLHALLSAAFPSERVRRGQAVAGFREDAHGVTARFADGREQRVDLLIGADGIRSTVRRQMLPEVAPRYAGYIAWRGLAEEAALSAATHDALFARFAFCLPDGEQMLGYPVAGEHDETEIGARRYNFVWYRPVDAERDLPRLQTDAAGRVHPEGISPTLLRPEIVAAMREDAERLLCPEFAEIVRVAAAPFFQPIFDLESPRLASARVALLGDAGFVARPHVGMGVTKAGEDAMTLADCLAADAEIPAALAAYQEARLPAGAAVIARARHLGAYMQAQLRSDEERAMAARYRTPEAVMRETAVSGA
jgi:2-polyprenyl-6-methoxyphenol hydroxylase-like FAD-dependent oxidoreductase